MPLTDPIEAFDYDGVTFLTSVERALCLTIVVYLILINFARTDLSLNGVLNTTPMFRFVLIGSGSWRKPCSASPNLASFRT